MLTERLGVLLELDARSRVLDVACGKGTSAIFLAERFGCDIVGIDYGAGKVEAARATAAAKGLGQRVRFDQADAEGLQVEEGSFDAIVCECAFCTFPNKPAAAREFARVLRAGGRVGLSDLTRSAMLPKELEGLLAWISCIADAQPLESYLACLGGAGIRVGQVEPHDAELVDMVHQVRMKLLAVEIMTGLKKLSSHCRRSI
jgi:ubiquinone/menaquinone biosynthesis C-methylase UbiE